MLVGHNDATYGLVAGAIEGACYGLAIWSAKTALEMVQKQMSLAKDYWQLSKNWLDYYQNYYKGTEDQIVDEAKELEPDEPYYEAQRGRHRTLAWIRYTGQPYDQLRLTSKYAFGLREKIVQDTELELAGAVALTDGLGYRNERAYLNARDDVRFKMRLNTAKLGRGMVGEAASLAQATSGIYGILGNTAWDNMSNAFRAGGYFSYYNKMFKQLPEQAKPEIVHSPLENFEPSVGKGLGQDFDTTEKFGIKPLFNYGKLR